MMAQISHSDHAPPRRALRQFFDHRPAVSGFLALIFFIVVSLVSLPYSLAWYDVQALEHVYAAPSLHSPAVLETGSAATTTRALPLAATLFDLGALFGFDSLGRSLVYRCLLGGLISLAIGCFAAALAVTVGVTWGACAGLAGGAVDQVLMRIVDVLYGLPYILVVILLKLALDAPLTEWLHDSRLSNVVILFVAIGANSWLTMARVIRGQVLALKHELFIDAARAYGATRLRILRRHLIPNLLGPIVVYGSLIVPQAILSESFLSFLGIGIQRPLPTWGSLAADSLHAVNSVVNHWWLLVFPCGLLSAALLALNFIGDGLRDALDPKAGVYTT